MLGFMENGPLRFDVEPSGCRLWSLVVALVSVGTYQHAQEPSSALGDASYA